MASSWSVNLHCRLSLWRPTATHCSVQVDPGYDAITVERNDRSFRGDQTATDLLELEEAGSAASISFIDGGVCDRESFGSREHIDVTVRSALQSHERALNLTYCFT